MLVRAGHQRLPGGLRWIVIGGGDQTGILVGVVGLDDETVALVIEMVLVSGAARRYDARLPGRIGRGDQVGLGGHVIRGVDHHVVLRRGQRNADEEAGVLLFVDDGVGCFGVADDVTTHLIRPPLLVDDGREQHRVVRGPHGATLGVVDDVVEQLPAVEVLDAQREALGARRVGAVGQQTSVVGHGERPAPEIPAAGGERRFVEDDVRGAGRPLLRAGVLRRPPRPYAVLRTFGESPLVVERAVLDRNVGVIRLLACLYFPVYRLDQFAARRHYGLGIGVLRLQVCEHVLVVDRGKAVVLQPAIGILHGQAVEGVGRWSRVGHGRRVCHVG